MNVFDVLALLLGVLTPLVFPHFSWWWLLLGWGVFFWFLSFRYRYLFFCFGVCWASLFLQLYFSSLLPAQYEMKPLLLKGEVVSFPVKANPGENFLMKIDTLSTLKHEILLKHGRVLLHADHGQVEMGSHYVCVVKLLRMHGLKNPGGVHAEWLAMANQTTMHGTVLQSHLERHGYSLRALLHERLWSLLPNTPHSAWLMALMLGDHSGVDLNDWSVLSNTGTNHLMVIGGLHLGMVAMFFTALIYALWRRSARLMLYLNAPMAAALGAWFFTVFYAYLAGFGVSTQRACIMLSVLTAAMLLRRQLVAWQAFALALMAVLIINPLSSVTLGFWLSFSTIALIIYGVAGRPYLKKSHLSFRLQWVLGLGLSPLMLYLFQSASVLSSFANIIAIPWLALTILPFCLLALVLCLPWPLAAKGCLWLAGQSLNGLWACLHFLSQSNVFMFHHALPSLGVLFLAMVGVLLLLSPQGTTARALGLVCLLPVFFTPVPVLLPGAFKLTVLDVGQGLSVVIETKNHVLVYDAGGHLRENDDKGERVVLPYLRYENRPVIDVLLISHGDNDHAGGANYLLTNTKVNTLLTSVPEKFSAFHAMKCVRGQQWVWEGVRFSILSPAVSSGFTGNNASCVLMIDNGHKRVLLPGDIEAPAESALLLSRTNLRANILIAPHHGSVTSSTPAFIAAVLPDLVIYSTGYHNHYGLPHPVIVKRYHDAGVVALNTVSSGAVELVNGS